jgi:hypothetical protein
MPGTRSEIKKKIDIHFNPILNNKIMSICKSSINKVYTKFDYASDGIRNILYICKCIEFCMIKGRYFQFLNSQSELRYFIINKLLKKTSCIYSTILCKLVKDYVIKILFFTLKKNGRSSKMGPKCSTPRIFS